MAAIHDSWHYRMPAQHIEGNGPMYTLTIRRAGAAPAIVSDVGIRGMDRAERMARHLILMDPTVSEVQINDTLADGELALVQTITRQQVTRWLASAYSSREPFYCDNCGEVRSTGHTCGHATV